MLKNLTNGFSYKNEAQLHLCFPYYIFYSLFQAITNQSPMFMTGYLGTEIIHTKSYQHTVDCLGTGWGSEACDRWLLIMCWVNTLRPRQHCRHFTDDIFKCIFLNEILWISRGKTTMDGAVLDFTQILAYLVHNMSRSQLYCGFGHFGWLPYFFRSIAFWWVNG